MKNKIKKISAYAKATDQMNRQVNHALQRVQLLQELYDEMVREKVKK